MRGRLLLLAVVILAVLPMAVRGTPCGADLDFHLQNWLELTRGWHQGVAYPTWDASANWGAGEPRFVFYPPVTRFLGAVLGTVMPWTWTPLVFVALALLAAGWAFRRMAREWVDDPAATLAACLYFVNPYMMFLIYERGALAELLAAAWMPLVVLNGLRRRPAVVPLAVAIALLWLTDAPAAVMGCYLLAVLVIVAALAERRWALLGRAAVGMGLGAGLAAFWMVPAIREQRWVEIWRAVGPLMRVEDSFPFWTVRLTGAPAYPGEPGDLIYHNHVLHTVSWIVGALMLATMLAAWRARRKRSRVWLPLVVVGAAICGLQLKWSEPVWRMAPKLAYVQFAWRWMLALGMVAAALAALAMGRSVWTRRATGIGAGVALAFACAMAALAGVIYWQPCEAWDTVREQVAEVSTTGFAGTDEYTPEPAELAAVQIGLPPVRVLRSADGEGGSEAEDENWSPDASAEIPAQVRVERWDSEDRVAAVTAPAAGYVVLRLMEYPAWEVLCNGVEVHQRPMRPDGLMAIPVPAGTNVIEVRWRMPGDLRAGIAISLGALAVTLALGWKERRVRLGEHDRNADRRQPNFA